MMHRIFLGIPIEETLQEQIAEWTSNYSRLPVRWIAGKNLHITLIPPWDETSIEGVIKELNSSVARVPFPISFDRVTYGPSSREPRLIWAEGATPRSLIDLKDSCERALGMPPPDRPFRLHLTLARFRPETFSSFPTKHFDVSVSWSMQCGSFVLYESRLLPHGAEYTVLASFPFISNV